MRDRSTPPSSARRRRLVLAAGLVLGTGTATAQVDRARDTLIKAAFLHKFASFVEWPEGTFARADTPLRIAVIGDDQVWQDLRDLARDRDRDGRPVSASRLSPSDSLAGYHIVYVRAPNRARLTELLQLVPEGVLTVADHEGEHPRGSVLSFYLDEGRVRFGASMDAALRQRLRLSPRLLSAARNVQGLLGLDIDLMALLGD